MNDSPKLNNYTFKHPPTVVNVFWEAQFTQHRLSDGSLVNYNKGYILKGTLGWGEDSWIEQDDYSNIAVMYNQLTATCVYYSRPDTYASRKFNVQITNSFNFIPHGGHLQTDRQLYEGSITFESSLGEITATASDIF